MKSLRFNLEIILDENVYGEEVIVNIEWEAASLNEDGSEIYPEGWWINSACYKKINRDLNDKEMKNLENYHMLKDAVEDYVKKHAKK